MRISQSRLQILASIPILVILAILGFGPITKQIGYTLNYVPTQGKVVSIGQLCRLHGRTPEAQAELDTYSMWGNGNWDDCDQADAFWRSNDTRIQQLDLIGFDKTEVLTVEYIAPADGSTRIAQLHHSYRHLPRPNPEPGGAVSFMAHKRDPALVSWGQKS